MQHRSQRPTAYRVSGGGRGAGRGHIRRSTAEQATRSHATNVKPKVVWGGGILVLSTRYNWSGRTPLRTYAAQAQIHTKEKRDAAGGGV
jgi:hypothetical protein